MTLIENAFSRYIEQCSFSFDEYLLEYISTATSHSFDDKYIQAAALSALTKQFKTSEMHMLVFDMLMNEEDLGHHIDVTQVFIKRLLKALFGRVGSQSLVASIYSTQDRTSKHCSLIPNESKSIDQTIDYLHAKHGERINSEFTAIIKIAKAKVKSEVSKKKSKDQDNRVHPN